MAKLIADITEEEKNKIKSQAALRGITIKELVLTSIREYLRRSK